MSDQNDSRVSNDQLVNVESASITPIENLLRNFLDRIAVDGSRDFSALRYLQSIASNSCVIQPDLHSAFLSAQDCSTAKLLVKCPAGCSLSISCLVISNNCGQVQFQDVDGNIIFPKMYTTEHDYIGPAVIPFPQPFITPQSKDIYVLSNGILSVFCTYFVLPRS